MPWSDPKTDWDTDDGFRHDDVNRMEENTRLISRVGFLKGHKPGVTFYANNPSAQGGSYGIRVYGEPCYWSQSAVEGPIVGSSYDILKLLSASDWAAGNGTTSPCKVPGSPTIGTNQWWYVFLLYNPTTDAFDVALDTSDTGSGIAGSAIETAGFTMWKRVAAVFEYATAQPPQLFNSYGSVDRYSIAEDWGTTGSSILLSGTTSIQLVGGMTGNPLMVPFGDCEVYVEFSPQYTGTLEVWSWAHGVNYYPGVGQTLVFNSVTDKLGLWVVADGGYILAYGQSLGTIEYSVRAYREIDIY